MAEDVLLGHASGDARTWHLADIDMVLGGDLPDHR
jgi:hypothetical protein